MDARRRRSTTERLAASVMLAIAGVALLAASCSSDSGSSETADSAATDSVATTTEAPGAELQGTWSVDLTLDPTAANDPGDATNVAETFHETWVFTETADGCEPGDAGCLVNTLDDGSVGVPKTVNVDGDGYITDATTQDDTLCDGSSPGTIHSTRTFSVDDDGQLTGVFHQTITPDDPADCGAFEGTYNLSGSIQEEGSTATTIASAAAELQGTWTVDVDFASGTSGGEPVATDAVSPENLHSQESWTFTETADGCQPGDAGCVQVTTAAGVTSAPLGVALAGDGYEVTYTNPVDNVCSGGTGTFPGTSESTLTFSVDAEGQLTGEDHQVTTADDPSCLGSDITFTVAGTLDEGDSTTTTSAP